MKKLLVVLVALFMSVAINAQAKKSIDDFAKKSGITTEQVAQLKSLMKEKRDAIKAIKGEELDKATTAEKIKSVNKSTQPKIVRVLGKEKATEFKAYFARPKKKKAH